MSGPPARGPYDPDRIRERVEAASRERGMTEPRTDDDKAAGLLRTLTDNGRFEDGWTRNVQTIVGFIQGIRIEAEASAPDALRAALTQDDIGCQYCWADPRYTRIADDPARRCPVCGADYTGPRRPSLPDAAAIDAERLAERSMHDDTMATYIVERIGGPGLSYHRRRRGIKEVRGIIDGIRNEYEASGH